MKVPFLDLSVQYDMIKDDIDLAIRRVIDDCAFAGGPFVEQFEREFASFCGSTYAVGVGSGTEALWLTLVSLDIGPGDEVITVPNTFIATMEAIHFSGATPVFVDIDPDSYNMDVNLLENAITSRTKAIIPVHLYGQMADMHPLMALAGKYGLHVVEDACQAHGATYRGRGAGTMGIAGCFSFYPGKNLGAYGDAGAVVTDDKDLAARIAMLRDHGQSQKYHHQRMGWNGRMDGLQGAILSVKLRRLSQWIANRRRHAAAYDERLADMEPIVHPRQLPGLRHVYHIYAIRIPRRDDIQAYLAGKNIHTAIHYPIPIHRQPAFPQYAQSSGRFPVSEQCADELLSLPMYPELNLSQIDFVCREIENAIRKFAIAPRRDYVA